VTSPVSLEGKVALITGATMNIGRSIAQAYAEAGAKLVITARTRSDLDKTASELSSLGCDVLPVAGDVADPTAAERTVGEAEAAFGKIDVLVNNAYHAGSARPFALEVPSEDWDRCWRTNVLGPYRYMQLTCRQMMQTGGSIINVLSIAAFQHVPGMTAYAATKAALWSLTRYVATEMAPNVRVNAISPGPVSEDGLPRTPGMARVAPLVPLQRIGRPDEVANVALFLASDASSYVTAQVIGVDGGFARHAV
jgi:NAD(P)-dependent dehydrogenase (short-subunit alcohol dehydrogenase family)